MLLADSIDCFASGVWAYTPLGTRRRLERATLPNPFSEAGNIHQTCRRVLLFSWHGAKRLDKAMSTKLRLRRGGSAVLLPLQQATRLELPKIRTDGCDDNPLLRRRTRLRDLLWLRLSRLAVLPRAFRSRLKARRPQRKPNARRSGNSQPGRTVASGALRVCVASWARRKQSPGAIGKAYCIPTSGTQTILTWPSSLRELSSAVATFVRRKKNAHCADSLKITISARS